MTRRLQVQDQKEKPILEHTCVRTGVIARLRRSPLGPYLDTLATSLHHEGYAPSRIQRLLCATEQFAQRVQGQGYAVPPFAIRVGPRACVQAFRTRVLADLP
jgi:hypothetical protein